MPSSKCWYCNLDKENTNTTLTQTLPFLSLQNILKNQTLNLTLTCQIKHGLAWLMSKASIEVRVQSETSYFQFCVLTTEPAFPAELLLSPHTGPNPEGGWGGGANTCHVPSLARQASRVHLFELSFLPIYSQPLQRRQTDLHNPQTIIIFASADESGLCLLIQN